MEELPSGVRVFFSSRDDRDRAAARVAQIEPSSICRPLECPDEDWAERSQVALESVRVGRLVVDPGREAPHVSPGTDDATVIVVRPSMGFGTGHHASTRLCLRLLQDEAVTGQRVIDVGTGSGVLAIAASRLGAASVLAVDNDPDALMAARENCALNGLTAVVTLRQADLAVMEVPPDRFDVVLGNLTGAVLIRHATLLTALARPGGRLLLSGILADEEAGVTDAYADAGCAVTRRLQEDEWLGLTLSPIPRPSTGR